MEENEIKKGPLDLDWDKLLPRRDDEPPPVLVVTSTSAAADTKQSPQPMDADEQEKSYREELSRMSNRELEEAIIRHKRTVETLSPKLGDGGLKLRARGKRLQEEMESRKLCRVEKDDGRCEKLTISKDPHFSSGPDCHREEAPSSLIASQSVFATHFCKKLEEKTDSRTVNAFEGELSWLGRCDRRQMKHARKSSKKERSKIALSSRQLPFQSPTNLSVDIDERIHLNANQDGGNHCSHSPCHSEEKLSTSFSKKKKVTQVMPSNYLRPRNGKNFLQVDEEEPEFIESVELTDKVNECMKKCKIYYPSSDHPESVEIRYADLECLAPKAYLSSTIMNFYIRYLQQPTSRADGARCDYHFFNTYFYEKLKKAVLKKNDQESLFVRFRRWWKGVSIFHKAYILIPIHENLHWSLVIICISDKEDESGPIILHLDSLGLHSSKLVFDNVKSFLREEWKYLNQEEAPLDLPIADRIWQNLPRRIEEKTMVVPQQRNDYDCGLFVLFFMERFIDEAPQRLKKKDLAMFGKKWFKPEEASSLRPKIRKLLLEEFWNATKDKYDLDPEPSSSADHQGKKMVHPIDC